MSEIEYKQADAILEILNNVSVSCGQCPLSKPCSVFHEEERNSICGILAEITQEYEEEQEIEEIKKEIEKEG